MAGTAAEIDAQLIAFVLPSIPESVRMARFHVRAALGFHELAQYADNAEIITGNWSPTRYSTSAATAPKQSG